MMIHKMPQHYHPSIPHSKQNVAIKSSLFYKTRDGSVESDEVVIGYRPFSIREGLANYWSVQQSIIFYELMQEN